MCLRSRKNREKHKRHLISVRNSLLLSLIYFRAPPSRSQLLLPDAQELGGVPSQDDVRQEIEASDHDREVHAIQAHRYIGEIELLEPLIALQAAADGEVIF